jgi:hypothetical protein
VKHVILDYVNWWNLVNFVNMWKWWVWTCCFIMLECLMINVDVKFIVNDLINCPLIIYKWICRFSFTFFLRDALVSLDYILFVEYNITLSGRSVDHRVISLNVVGWFPRLKWLLFFDVGGLAWMLPRFIFFRLESR